MRKNLLNDLIQAPLEISRNLYQFKHVIRQMIKSEIKGKFAGSFAGLLWHVIHPLVMLGVYVMVFLFIFDLKVGSSSGTGTSTIYLLSGLFPWMMIAEGISLGTVAVIQNANLIKRTYFPTEILLAKSVMAPFCSFGIVLGVLALFRVLLYKFWGLLLILPCVVVLQLVFTMGVTLFTATISVFFRDIVHLVDIIIRFWIFLTPILYPVSRLPEWGKTIMFLNPLYPLISIYQSLFLTGVIQQWRMVWLALLWTLGLLIPAAYLFNKLKYEFADWL